MVMYSIVQSLGGTHCCPLAHVAHSHMLPAAVAGREGGADGVLVAETPPDAGSFDGALQLPRKRTRSWLLTSVPETAPPPLTPPAIAAAAAAAAAANWGVCTRAAPALSA